VGASTVVVVVVVAESELVVAVGFFPATMLSISGSSLK
jgi:hypothetical protein